MSTITVNAALYQHVTDKSFRMVIIRTRTDYEPATTGMVRVSEFADVQFPTLPKAELRAAANREVDAERARLTAMLNALDAQS